MVGKLFVSLCCDKHEWLEDIKREESLLAWLVQRTAREGVDCSKKD